MGATRGTRSTGAEGFVGRSVGRQRTRYRHVGVVARSLLAGVVVSLVFAVPAFGSCPIPQGTHFVGEYHTEYAGSEIGSGTFDSISKEFTETAPGSEFRFNAITEYAGKYAGKALYATGTVTGQEARLVCVNGIGIEEIGLEHVESLIEGIGSVQSTGHSTGTYTDTAIAGESQSNFGEKTTYTGTFSPLAGSQGTEPGSTEVIAPFGTVASQFTVAPATGAQLPPGAVAPAGALSFSVSGVPVNGTITVVLVLPPGSAPTAIYKPVGGGLYEQYPADKTKVVGNLVALELTDNESPWDEDPAPGVIGDPVVPVQPSGGGTVPTVSGLSPKSATAGVPTTVTIAGSGLDGATAVRFGSKEATIESSSPNSVTVLASSATLAGAGKVDVTVASSGGVSAISTKDRFTFKAPKKVKPAISSVTPNSGTTAGGGTVTVTGSGFAGGPGATVFKFGKTLAAPVNCASSTQCAVVVPAHVAGTVDIVATANKANTPKSAADHYTYN